MVVGPTNDQPRFFKSFERVFDSALTGIQPGKGRSER